MLQMPSLLTVEIQPTGRGTTSALNGIVPEAMLVGCASRRTRPALLLVIAPQPAPAGGDPVEVRPVAVGLLFLGRADVDEAGHALVVRQPERGAHAGAVGVPLGDPARAEPQRVGGQAQVHASRAAGEDLLPLRCRGVGHGARDDGRPRSAPAAGASRSISSRAGEGGSFSSAAQASLRTRPNSARASPSNTMKRQGSSFLWSGTRAAARQDRAELLRARAGLGQQGRLRGSARQQQVDKLLAHSLVLRFIVSH